ncbi:TonB-dependent receptor [Massilia sp. erpn]|uniref:TonB-dependent receptor n=1 Tax=Massilia sp. erpn TaxID=2738142 RepID=UPI002102C531|nr:TonB-dependent receptor [Massilia sp. erpn]UTY56096.1 TonB-dependent receptor [Massilia sp. erpn]
MIEKVLSRSLRVMFAGSLLVGMHAASAQEAMQRVEITGSSIKRVAAEAALPVQSFSQKDIQKSGVSSVTDFIQQIPAMQGFNVAAESVGGGGGGVTTASIHDIGPAYTLVLLNGRRVAPSNSGTTIDLNSIPLSAIERVEVLTDGASALYGADAIAGVVNFILKKGATQWEVKAKYSRPEEAGGASESLSLSKGFGNLEEDGYSLFFALSHDKQKQLKASQRDFAKTGIINFTDPKNGKALQFINGSPRAVPANASVIYNDAKGDSQSIDFNPFARMNGGKCASANVDAFHDGSCYYDYTSTVEINPESKRDALFSSGSLKLGNSGFNGFFDLAYTKASIVARIAPYPAEFSLKTSSPLYSKYILPYLTPEQAAGVTAVSAKYRLYEMGNRGYDYATTATHLVTGVDGSAFGWDINSALTYSKNKQDQKYLSGFPLEKKFNAAIDAGLFDPFGYEQGKLPQAMRDVLNSTGYTGSYNVQTVTMTGFDARASRNAFQLPAGTAMLGLGLDYRKTKFKLEQSDTARDAAILFDSPQVDNGYQRDTSGAYAELVTPLLQQLEMTTSLRYDRIGSVKDNLTGRDVGKSESAATYKVSAKYTPMKNLMLRGAVGSGFRAADMSQIASPLVDFGVTGAPYACPLSAANGLANHPLAKYCPRNRTQLEAFKGGNPELSPEKSKQWSVGAVFEPIDSLSLSLDLWNVSIRDQVTEVSEGLIAAYPNQYLDLFTTKHIGSTGQDVLAIKLLPMNVGQVENRGIDYDLTHKAKLFGGKLTSRLAGTFLLRSRYTRPGTSDQWETSLNRFGFNDKVSFRNIIRATSSWESAQFTHTATASYRNGYTDKNQNVDSCAVVTADAAQACYDITLRVPSYTTFDWQTQYRPLKNVELTAGIVNLFDRKPPFSLRNTGPHQIGYNPAYSSALGRQFYLSGAYKF